MPLHLFLDVILVDIFDIEIQVGPIEVILDKTNFVNEEDEPVIPITSAPTSNYVSNATIVANYIYRQPKTGLYRIEAIQVNNQSWPLIRWAIQYGKIGICAAI